MGICSACTGLLLCIRPIFMEVFLLKNNTKKLLCILLAIAAGQVLIVEFGGEVFRTEPLAWREWAAVIGCTSLLAIGGEAVRALRRKR